jgi:hypothetical protein
MGAQRLKLRLSGSARKSQTRLRDTTRFKFQAVLSLTQPLLSRRVEKRGDQSRFKSLGLYINVILVAGVGTFRHTSAVLMASRHALSPRCETKTMFSAPFYILKNANRIFAKTGSGQAPETLGERRPFVVQGSPATSSTPGPPGSLDLKHWCGNAFFAPSFSIETRSWCQDRLGTNRTEQENTD